MTQILAHMLWPLLACFVLVGIHAYLGIHVIARKVIFVDLALAQIAALGAVYAVFIGLSLETNSWTIKAISVGFTLIGALLFAFTQKHDEGVPHEAIIGIIYAGALSVTVLLTANLPHGADEVQQMLAGNILWVTPQEVKLTALLYASIGLVHILFRRPFFALTERIAKGYTLSFKERLWDFLFYATFGVVVTSSVGIGGVLLVFGYLVIPAVLAVMIAQSTKARLGIAWGSGLAISTLGVVASYHLDLPSGPTIVVLLAALLILVSIILSLFRSFRHALWQLTLLIAMLALIGLPFLWTLSPSYKQAQEIKEHDLLFHEGKLEESLKELLTSDDKEKNIIGLNGVKEHRLSELLPLTKPFLFHSDAALRELSVQLIADLKAPLAMPWLKEAIKVEDDEFIKIEIAQILANMGGKEGLLALIAIMQSADSSLARDDALLYVQTLVPHAPKERGRIEKWLNEHKEALKFDEKTSTYKLK